MIADQELLKSVLVKQFVSFSDRIVSLKYILHIGVGWEEMHFIHKCTGSLNFMHVANLSRVSLLSSFFALSIFTSS